MNETSDLFLFHEDLTPEQREIILRTLAADPGLREAFARWQRLRLDVRQSLDTHLPDRSLLVLYALEASHGPEMLTPLEQKQLQTARPDLERAFAKHPALADVVRQIREEADDFDTAWNEHVRQPANRSADRLPSPQASPDRTPLRLVRRTTVLRWAGRAAAAIAVVAFTVILLLVLQRDNSLITVETASGEVRLIQLADGSTVRLMGRSKLTFPDPEEETALNRRAQLVGRAFFEISKSERPFTLETPTALTTVLGTSFGVEADGEATEVVLATGKVSLAPNAAPERIVLLEPEEMSRVAQNALPSTPTPVDLAEALDWTGLLVFHATPLEKIAAMLSERYDTDVAVAPSLEQEPVSGTFEQSQPLPEILEALSATLGTDVRANPSGGYLLVPLL